MLEILKVLTPVAVPILLWYLNKKDKKINDKLDNIECIVNENRLNIAENTKRQKEKLAYQLYHDFKLYLEQGHIHVKDFIAIQKIFNEYVKIGGNGEIAYLFSEVEKLERKGEL